jgi:hypothetical protein
MSNQTFKKDPANRGNNDKNELFEALKPIWLGRQDSNLRMPVPKTGALPLGHAPMNRLNFSVIRRLVQIISS